MITKERFAQNLDILRNRIPKKPTTYTSDHPINLKEALYKYSNQRSVNGIEINTRYLNENNWSLPLWVNLNDIKFGFWNKLYYKKFKNSFKVKNRKFKGFKDFDYLYTPSINQGLFKRSYDDTIYEGFCANIKYIGRQLSSNSLLEAKQQTIKEIFVTYRKKLFRSCINTIFPLLDFVARKLLKTNKLTIDVMQICKLFNQNGFSIENIDNLTPFIAFQKAANLRIENKEIKINMNEAETLAKQIENNKFGIVGPALNSFLHFAHLIMVIIKVMVEIKT